jgi:hypothetical protein
MPGWPADPPDHTPSAVAHGHTPGYTCPRTYRVGTPLLQPAHTYPGAALDMHAHPVPTGTLGWGPQELHSLMDPTPPPFGDLEDTRVWQGLE